MRICDKSFICCSKERCTIKPFVRIAIQCFTLILIICSLVPQTFGEKTDWRLIKNIGLDHPPIDIDITQDGGYIFILTAKDIIVYSRRDEKIVDRVPVDKAYDNISFSRVSNEFILSSAASKSIDIIKIYPLVDVNIKGSPFVGPKNAPVTIVVFDDYRCSACKLIDQTLQDVLKNYPKEVKLVIKNYPNQEDVLAMEAANAARAANLQGKFWEFHRALFEKQDSLSKNTILSIAKQLKLNMKKFNKDLNSKDITTAVDQDLKEGKKLKIRATPTIFINGKYLEHKGFEDISNMIEAELNKRGSTAK